jgi:hypothetical protein
VPLGTLILAAAGSSNVLMTAPLAWFVTFSVDPL